jgi:hypothetical protein
LQSPESKRNRWKPWHYIFAPAHPPLKSYQRLTPSGSAPTVKDQQSLIEGGRSFTKTLRYDLPDEATIAAAILKDGGAEGVALFLDDGTRADALRQALGDCPMPTWVWNVLDPMPP